MTDCLRFLRLGLVNILGITVPGILLVSFFSVGFLLPLAICTVPLCQRFVGCDSCVTIEQLASLWTSHEVLVVSTTVVLAYIAGYILRLSSPDELDRISGNLVVEKMKREAATGQGADAKRDRWPYQGERKNKFPYLHFRDYLDFRGLNECAALVTWGKGGQTGLSARSKTHVNMMKLELMMSSPDLSAMIESNEAHVRLMFGTWEAITATWKLVLAGAVMNVIALSVLASTASAGTSRLSAPYGTSLLVNGTMLMAMFWAKDRIQRLFHYQRVRELFHIVASVHYARKEKERTNSGPNPIGAPPRGSPPG